LSAGTDGEPPRRRFEGAEAVVSEVDFCGLRAMRKTRPVKSYRDPELDRRLRSERLRTEVRLLREARRAGVRTPIVLDIDPEEMALVLERLDGPTLTEVLAEPPASPRRVRAIELWGRALGRLHRAGISHGDLTASNVVWTGEDVGFLDLSLGSRTPGLEEMGVDLHLVQEDLNTLCADRDELFERFLRAYQEAFPNGAAAVLERAAEIQGRVRYS
jgi:Kae1-associated kinase Bud32